MLNDGVWPIWVVTVGVVLPLFAVMVACVCCRKTEPKNELLGLAGMVKITNPEENVNHNQQQNEVSVGPVIENTHSVADASDPSKRASTTANRSLPDIPVERLPLDNTAVIWEGNEPNGDTSSELYATVEENKNVAQSLVARRSNSRNVQKHTTLERAESDNKTNVQADDGFSPYSEHPYDKLKSEHPYAQVGASHEVQAGGYRSEGFADLPSSHSEESSVVHTNESISPRSSSSHLATPGNPVPPPRTRRSSSHNSLVLAVPDIQAATAIAGRISANQELPYMTPPIAAAEVAMPQQIQQANFSGDSQDSKGYTSISVREPLANIKAQTKVASQRSRTQELVDSHYATVSDDSDEMYAAIDEPGQVYTSGSETYAQIQPLAVLDPGLKVPETAGESSHYPPQPPSVDSLKHVAQVHSRQASSSSATSSVANLGSPKPEKRQANSPLPLPPAGSPELYAAVDKKGAIGLSVNRNLEEMYAKVMKKKQRGTGSNGKNVEETERGSSSSVLDVTDSLSHHSITSVETVSSQDSPELQTQQDTDGISACSSEHDSILGFGPVITRSDPAFGSIAPHYEVSADNIEPSYESLGGPSSINTSYHDPGYEVVQHHSSDCDPNYEELRPKLSDVDSKIKSEVMSEITSKSITAHQQNLSMGKAKFEGTSSKSIRTTNKGAGLGLGEPGYEQVKSRDPEYEPVRLGGVEPDYASVNRNRNKDFTNINKSQANVSSASVVQNVDESVPMNEADYYGMVRSKTERGYAEIGASSQILLDQLDPGYEQVGGNSEKHGGGNTSNKLSPAHDGYERVEPPPGEPDYAVVDRHQELPLEYADDSGEPNYESMSSEGQDSSYALVSRTTGDPNYESVNYFNEFDLPCDPPYERLNNETRDSDDTSSGYEKVKDHDLDETQATVTYAEPNYEEVGTKWDTMNGNAEAMPSSLQDRAQKDQSNFNVYRQQEESNQTRM